MSAEKGLLEKPKSADNCQCLEKSYAQSMNRLCTSIGDCGAYINVMNKFTDDGAESTIDGDKQTITKAIMGGGKK